LVVFCLGVGGGGGGGGGQEGFSSQPMLLRHFIFQDSLCEVMS